MELGATRYEPIGPKFKEGDEVRVIGDEHHGVSNNGKKTPLNTTARINEVFEKSNTYPCRDGYTLVGWDAVIPEQDLELVTPHDVEKEEMEEEMEIKVGDRVRRGPTWDWYEQDGGKGNIGEVIEDDGSQCGIKVRWAGGMSHYYRCRNGYQDLELANEKTKNKTKKEDVMSACEGKSREERAKDNDKRVKEINEQIKCLKEEVKTLNAESKNLRAYETDRDETIAQIKLAKKCKQDEAEAILALKDKGITV
jgi:hypothetical protein